MNLELASGILIFSILFGVLITRRFALARQRRQVARRLAIWQSEAAQPVTIVKNRPAKTQGSPSFLATAHARLDKFLLHAGVEGQAGNWILLCSGLLILPFALCLALDLPAWFGALIGVLLASVPFFVIFARRAALRRKFLEQLPDAMDLMVSVLRSGHSIPQAVKSVAQEIAQPCGTEFAAVLQRMNLGQPLSLALIYSAEKFRSDELDLIRRAIAIQAEVGGSLSDLLEKTNSTLRGRLKLARQVQVLTAQSRLTGVIVGLLPIVLACVLNFMSPGYLSPLFNSQLGQALLMVAVALQTLGVLIMRRMATVRV